MTEVLWQEAEPVVEKDEGLLIFDDSTLDKPYANKIEHVTWHQSGKHKDMVKGINLLTLLWRGSSDSSLPERLEAKRLEEEKQESHVPCDFRLYQKEGKTKNEHFREMTATAAERGFEPERVLFNSWYRGLDNLKTVRDLGWTFLTRLKKNRKVNPDDTFNRQIQEIAIPGAGRMVHLKGFGFVKVFQTVSTDEDADYAGGVGIPHRGPFIHVDLRGYRARW